MACSQILNENVIGKESSSNIYRAVFALAMSNSFMNPIIYAWKNRNFRRAFGRLLRCQYPDVHEMSPMTIRSKSCLNEKHANIIKLSVRELATNPLADQANINLATVTSVMINVDKNQVSIENKL